MITPTTPIEQLTRVGKTTAKRLAYLGIHTTRDLLFHIPRKHEDLSEITFIKDLVVNQKVTIKASVNTISTKRSPRRRLIITTALVSDETGSIACVWFNQPYLSQTIKPQTELFLTGTTKLRGNELQLSSPTYEKVTEDTTHTNRIVPFYPLTAGLTQKQIRFLLKQALPAARLLPDHIPKSIRKKFDLLDVSTALEQIHFPDSNASYEQALYRLKFDELFVTLLLVELAKTELITQSAITIPFQKELIQDFVEKLPFTLTTSQKKTAWTIIQDIEKPTPMNRLLEGDVGSGKTVVAAIAALNTISQNYQVVVLAPTDVLVQQHFATFTQLLADQPYSVALLTRTTTQLYEQGTTTTLPKKELLKIIANGSAKLIIGTHAVLQESVAYNNLALIVIDEQHRFGVNQRKQLKDKTPEYIPHFLSMTATPIPRSLALTLYGDLAISILNEKPKNRKPIITKMVTPKQRDSIYQEIREHIAAGNQAFVICPLVSESEKLDIKSAEQEYQLLSQKIFPDLQVGLVHGKLKKQAKEAIMQQFRNKELDVLVATAVVEVGVDIPDATIMLIEAAERFGLAQLHQFRGRIGRSDKQSYCYLFTSDSANPYNDRLKMLTTTNNGFELAEYDLKLRGPGDIYGYKQSGLPDLSIASLADTHIMEQAQQAAQSLLQQDKNLSNHPDLQKIITQKITSIHFE